MADYTSLALDLRRHLANEIVTARPPTTAYLLGKLIRRNKLVFVAGLAIFSALVAGIALASWQAHLARVARNAAEGAKADAIRQAGLARDANEAAQMEKSLAQQEAERRRLLLDEASNLSHEAAMSRLRDAKPGDERSPEALAYLSRSLAFNPANLAAQATALLTMTGPGLAIGPRWPAYTFPSSAAICASDDGLTLATVEISEPGKSEQRCTIYLIDLRDKLPKRKFAEINGRVSRMVFRPDGAALAVDEGSSISMWDVQKAARVGEPIKMPSISEFEFSPDGRWLATGSLNHTARIWDVQTGQPVSPLLEHDNQVTVTRFSSDSRRLLTVVRLSATAHLWDVPTGNKIGEPIKQRGAIDAAEFTPDGKAVATAERWGAIRLWDMETRQPSPTKFQHDMFVDLLRFRKDGRWLVSVCRKSSALLASLEQPDSKPLLLDHSGEVKSADFSPDGQWVATASQDGTVKLWTVETGKPVCEPLAHPVAIQEVRFAPSGKWIFAQGNDNTLRVWECPSAPNGGRHLPADDETELLKALTEPRENRKLSDSLVPAARRLLDTDPSSGLPTSRLVLAGKVFISPDKKTIVASTESRQPVTADGRIWRTADWTMLGVTTCPATVHPVQFEFTPDSSRLVVQGYDRGMESDSIRVFDTATGQLVPPGIDLRPSLHGIHVSHDGKYIAVLHTLKDLQIYRMTGLEPLHKTWIQANAQYAMFNSVVFSPDDTHVLTSSDRSLSADIWGIQTGKPAGLPMKHGDAVNSAAYSEDGKLIVTASNDRTARIWDAKTQTQIGLPLRHPAAVRSARFSKNGNWILTTTSTGYLTLGKEFLWETRSGRLVASLKTEGRFWFGDMPDWLGFSSGTDYRAHELPELAESAPSELIDFLELHAGLKIDAKGGLVVIQSEEATIRFAALRQKVTADPSTSVNRFLRWALEDPRTRKLSPRDQNSVPEIIESFVNFSQHAGSQPSMSALNEAWLLDPLHPLVAIALSRVQTDPGTASMLREYGVKQRLLAGENEKLYGRETLARYCRTAVRLLLNRVPPTDTERIQLARAVLALGKRLDPGSPALAEIERMLDGPR